MTDRKQYKKDYFQNKIMADPVRKEKHRLYTELYRAANQDKIKAYRAANKEKLAQYAKNQAAKIIEFINSQKNSPCVDCNQSYPPCVMDFDHIPGRGTKLFNIAEASRMRWDKQIIQEEIDKCELVCSNCHRIRTNITRKQ